MSIIDLTQPLNAGISIYPGDRPPLITPSATIKHDGYRAKWLEIGSHSGTHIDAPAHLMAAGKTLDQFPAHHFLGLAQVVDCRELVGAITLPFLQRQLATSRGIEFILLLTGWSQHWGTADYLLGFPTLTAEASLWLTTLPLKGIGIDALSLDPTSSSNLPNHHYLLERDILLIENLTNLSKVPHSCCQLICLPLLIHDSDGAPARVLATVP